MSEPEYLDTGLLSWPDGMVIGAFENPKYAFIKHSQVVESVEPMEVNHPNFTHTFLQLRHYPSQNSWRMGPANKIKHFTWAILQWYGTASNPEGRIVEVWFFKDLNIDWEDAKSFFHAGFEKTWRSTGWMFPKLAAERAALEAKSNKKPTPLPVGKLSAENLYLARLKVLGADLPMTASAMKSKNPDAVELWKIEAENLEGSKIDRVNYDLALNWAREYDDLTANEVADKILERTGIKMQGRTLEKRREALNLFTKRPTGPKGFKV